MSMVLTYDVKYADCDAIISSSSLTMVLAVLYFPCQCRSNRGPGPLMESTTAHQCKPVAVFQALGLEETFHSLISKIADLRAESHSLIRRYDQERVKRRVRTLARELPENGAFRVDIFIMPDDALLM